MAQARTAKACGPDTAVLVSSLAGSIPQEDGGNKPLTGESTNQPLTPLRREGRVLPVNLW